jgi:suppressor of G2 allele of SKP1
VSPTSNAPHHPGDGALDALFKTLYAAADDDTRRAMNKSYSESGGTCLSTNWQDIGSRTVACEPPDSMQARKYEQ